MQISVAGHHFDLTNSTKSYIEQELSRLQKFYDPLLGATVTLTKEGRFTRADIVIRVHAQTLKSSQESEHLSPAFDGAIKKMIRQLKKLHDKRRKPRPDIVPQVMADSTD